MRPRIQVRHRVNSGNIKDPDLHQERLTDIRMKRQAFWTVTLVVVGSIAFTAMSMVIRLSS